MRAKVLAGSRTTIGSETARLLMLSIASRLMIGLVVGEYRDSTNLLHQQEDLVFERFSPQARADLPE